MWEKIESIWAKSYVDNEVFCKAEKYRRIGGNTRTSIKTYIILAALTTFLMSPAQLVRAQETLSIPSYYGGSGTATQAQQSNTSQQQQLSIQNYQNLISNIRVDQNLVSQLSESEQVVANPTTGEVRTVGTTDPTPSGWMRLDVTPTANGYTLGDISQGGQFSYTIQSQPTTVANPTTFQIAQAQPQTPIVAYNPTGVAANGAQTRVSNSSQTTVGDTTTQSLANGSTLTSTPTETVDTQVTTISTADSETIITETTTTTMVEGTVQGIVSGEGSMGGQYATQGTNAQQATQVQQATQATGYVSPFSPADPYNPQTVGTAGTGAASSTLSTVGPAPVVDILRPNADVIAPEVLIEYGLTDRESDPGYISPFTPNNSYNPQTVGTAGGSSSTGDTLITIGPAVSTTAAGTSGQAAPSVSPASGAQTTVTNDTQTTVGETTTQTLDNGASITTTPTETVDTTVTTTTTPNSETIITETMTTTLIEGTVQSPTVSTEAGAGQSRVGIENNGSGGFAAPNTPVIQMGENSTTIIATPEPIVDTRSPLVSTPVSVGSDNGASTATFELGDGSTPTPDPQPQHEYNLSEQEPSIGVELKIQQGDCQGPDCPPTPTTDTSAPLVSTPAFVGSASDGPTIAVGNSDVSSSDGDAETETASSDDVAAADASKTETTEGSPTETSSDTTESEVADNSSPAVVANEVSPTASGLSQADRELAAARAAEEARIRRAEDIRRTEEASNLRSGAQDRAMQLLEGDSPAMASGQMGNSEGMMDPQRMSIFSQNARIRAGNNNGNLSAQISSLSNTVASVTDGLDDIMNGGPVPCPPILANACDEAADRAAALIEEELRKAREKAQKEAEEDLDDLDDDIEEGEEKAGDEQEDRDNRSDKEKKRDALEEAQRQREKEIQEEADRLEAEADRQRELREKLEQEEGDLRRAEQDARRNGDPNCRGPVCQGIREQRQSNSRATTDLARAEGMLQRDQGNFSGSMREFRIKQAEIDALWQGDPVFEAKNMQADAHERARDAQSKADRLREEQLNLRRQGGSGSRQDRAYDRAIERAQGQADAAAQDAHISNQVVLQAQFYDNGMQEEWKEYENARIASDAFNNFLDAGRQVDDVFERRNGTQDALNAARQDPDFDPDSLESMEQDLADLNRQLTNAERARDGFRTDIGTTTKNLTGTAMPPTNETSRALSDRLRTISSDFSERQRLGTLTDAELQTEIDMLGEARQRVAAARNGLGGNVQDPGGPLTDRYNELTSERQELQGRINNFDPGGNGTGIVFGADQAYRDMQSELNRLDGELDKMAPIAAADSAFDRVAAHNEWSDDLLDGFPTDGQGNIDRMAFRGQVAEVAQLQMDFVQANNNLQQARSELEQAQASGDPARLQQAQLNYNEMELNVGSLTNQFELRDINVMVSPDGDFALDVENIGASATWSAAAEGVSKFETDAATARAQLASARRGTVPGASSDVFGPPPPPDTDSNAGGSGTRTRDNTATEPIINTDLPVDPPGGFIGPLQMQEQVIVEQRQHAGASTAARNSQPPATVAQLAQATATAKEAARQKINEARSVARDAEEAKFGVEIAEQEAEFRQKLADDNAETRERQADEYVDLAESATDQADDQRDRAEDLEAQADRLRASAERNQRLADNSEDKSLARDAQTAADRNNADAAARDAAAEKIRSEAARDDERADRLADSGEDVREDAEQLKEDAETAKRDAENARAEAERLDAEVLRLAEEADGLNEQALATSTEMARLQTDAFNELMNDPPEGWRWSALDSNERSAWLNENIPQWGTLNTAQRIDFLERLELGEARKDFIDQNARYKEFNESSQGQRSSPEMLESRGRDLIRVQARIKELDEMTIWTDEEEAEHKILKEGLEVGVARLRSDQRARTTEEKLRYETWQEANRKLWASNDEARAEEVQKQVNTYVTAIERVETAKNMQAARTAAFDTREAAIQNRINNPTSAADAEVARGELTKLTEARNFWGEQDASTVGVTQTFADDVRREVTYFGTMNGLGEIGFDDQLEARAAGTRVSTAVMGVMLGLPPQPDQTASIQAAVNGLDFKEPDFDPWIAMIDGYDATAKTVSDIGVSFGVVGGGIYGTAEGVVTGVVGMVDVFVIEPLDLFFETLELYAEEVSGAEIDVFGTDNLDFINSLGGGEPGDLIDLGVKFAVSQGKKVSEGVDRVGSAYQTGSVTDGFTGASDVTAVAAELFIDPTLAFAGITKVAGVLRAVDKVDDIAHAANVLDDVARGLDAAGDVTRSGNAAQDAARTGEVVGDSVRFSDRAHAAEASGAYQGLDELLGPEFANAFGTTPRAPVLPPARPTPLRAGGNAPRTPLPPREGPYQGLDELLGPEFRNAFDDLPVAPRDGPTPYQGLDELLGPEFANAFGSSPRPPVYPPVRTAPVRGTPAGAPPVRPAPDGPFQGLDEILGPEFRNALDDAPGVPRDGPSPYQGLDEILGPEFSNAFGTTPRAPVYPPVRTPLGTGGPAPRSPAAPLAPRDGPYQGLDELLGPEFRNALDEPLSGGRTGPGDTLPIPRDGPGGTMPIPRDGPGGTLPIPRDGPGGTAPIPRDGPGGTAPLAANGPNGIPPTIRDGIPPTIRDGIPPTIRDGVPSGGGRGDVPPTFRDGVPPSSGTGIPPTNAPRGRQPIANALPDSNPPLAAGQAGDAVNVPAVRIPDNPAPIVSAKQYGDVIVVHLDDGSSFSLAKGEILGAGSFTEVSALRGANQGRVLKEAKDLAGTLGISVEQATEIANIAARLDKVGADGLRALPKWVQDNVIYTPEIYGEFKVIAANDNVAGAARAADEAGDLAGKSLRVTERASVPTYADAKGWQTPMSTSEVNAFNRGQHFTNEGGKVILDIKSNNFGFEDLANGIKRTVVHDPGATVPTIGRTAAERAANAKVFQRALLTPDEALVTSFKNASAEAQRFRVAEAEAIALGDVNAATNARRGANAASEKMFNITTGHGNKVMERYGGLLDMEKIQVPLDKIPFNPTLGFTQDGIRAANRANAARVANDNIAGLGNAAASGS